MTETITDNFYFFPDGHSYQYASVVDFYSNRPDSWWGGVWLGTGRGMESSLAWTHTLPAGLEGPSSAVKRAKLWIDGAYINTDGNLVEIQGTSEWNPLNHIWFDNTTYNLGNVATPGFWNQGGLDVDIWAGECGLRIDQAVLMIDYTNASAVPEPASLLLMGLGILGGLVHRKLRRS